MGDMQKIILKELKIERNYKGQLSGRLQVDSDKDAMWLAIDERLCQKIIDVCADKLVEVATEAAEALKAKMIDGIAENKILIEGR